MTARVQLAGTRAIDRSASGPAVIVSDFRTHEVGQGSVVVARHARPDVVFVLERVAGMVFEYGGPASHGAILAREAGVPCSVGVAGVLDVVSDGDWVRIDGSDGTVTVTTR